MDAQEAITAALEAYPALSMLVADVQRLVEVVPQEARGGALLFLIASLVAAYGNDPRRAVIELNAHALDAVHHALTV